MADKPSSFAFLNTILVFAIIIGLCLWLWMVISAQGERRLEQACKPIEYSTQFLHELTTAIIGRQPTWTLYVQQYLMSGCYYSFSLVLAHSGQQGGSEFDGGSTGLKLGTDEPTAGGIQAH